MLEYDSREARQQFIVKHFGDFIKGSVINIGGGGEKSFLKYAQPKEYLELDFAGHPDIQADLDKDFPLPIQDNCFDTVICTDVLEHLDQFHRVFKELLRISRRYVIISVPNALMEVKHYLKRQKYTGVAGQAGVNVGYYTKYYGLPKQQPQDRHRWFFSYTEAQTFFREQAQELGYNLVKEYPIGTRGATFKWNLARSVVKKLWGEDLYKDLFCSVYWCILEKKSPRPG